MTTYIYAPQPRRKETKKALSKKIQRGVVTISLMRPPLTYRTGTKRVTPVSYYF